ncbi:hypothetical protein QQ045_009217 [Rhodiola kirilowii]
MSETRASDAETLRDNIARRLKAEDPRSSTTHKRKPLSDRTNITSSLNRPNTRSSLLKLPPPIPNSAAAAAAASKPVERSSDRTKKQQLIHTSTSETHKKRKRRQLADLTTLGSGDTDDANKENVNTNISPDSPPFTPSPRQPLSPQDEPLTVYARRQTTRRKGKEKVVNEAFTCLPVERKRTESSKASFGKVSKCFTDLPKKARVLDLSSFVLFCCQLPFFSYRFVLQRRIKEHVVSKDYIEKQRAYFAEIDNCELPEEEVSESELSDH